VTLGPLLRYSLTKLRMRLVHASKSGGIRGSIVALCTEGTYILAQHLQECPGPVAQEYHVDIAGGPVGDERRIRRPAVEPCIGMARVEVVRALRSSRHVTASAIVDFAKQSKLTQRNPSVSQLLMWSSLKQCSALGAAASACLGDGRTDLLLADSRRVKCVKLQERGRAHRVDLEQLRARRRGDLLPMQHPPLGIRPGLPCGQRRR